MDITEECVGLYESYLEMIGCDAERFSEALKIFEGRLRNVSRIFGIDQYNIARYRLHLEYDLLVEAYKKLLVRSPEAVEISSGKGLPVFMGIDLMDCGRKIAVIETNGFTSRGFSSGECGVIASSLLDHLSKDGGSSFAVGYPLEEGKSKKSDDLVFEKLLYCGALARTGINAKIILWEGKEIEPSEGVTIFILPKRDCDKFEIKDGKVFLGGNKIDFISDNLMRMRPELLECAESVNPNGTISDSKHLTYAAIDRFLGALDRESRVYPLSSGRVDVKRTEALEKEITEIARGIIDSGGRVLVKPDKGSGGSGIYFCDGLDEVPGKVRESSKYAPDGNVLVMECAPVVPVDLDLTVEHGGGEMRAGDLLEHVIREVHWDALDDGVPDEFLRGRHAVDFRFYVVCLEGKDVMERTGVKGLKEDAHYLFPQGALLRMAPGLWSDDPSVLALDPTIIKTNISQEVAGKGAKVEHGILRFLITNRDVLDAFGYSEKFSDFLAAAFDAVRATVEYADSPPE